jgi:DNA replication protein DnaC
MTKFYSINSDGLAVLNDDIVQYHKERVLTAIGIPKKYWDLELENFVEYQDSYGNELNEIDIEKKSKARQLVAAYCSQLPRILNGNLFEYNIDENNKIVGNNLVIVGGASSGKTMLGCIIAKSGLDYTHNIKFYPWTNCLKLLSNYTDDKRKELSNNMSGANILIIDGVCAYSQKPNSAFNIEFDSIISNRLNMNKPTIITSHDIPEVLINYFEKTSQSFFYEAIVINLPNGSSNERFKVIN